MSSLGEFIPWHESSFVQLWSWMSHAVLGALPTVLEGDGLLVVTFIIIFKQFLSRCTFMSSTLRVSLSEPSCEPAVPF